MGTIDTKKTGIRIKSLVKERNITPKQLVKDINIGSVEAVYKWYKGITLPNIDNMVALANYLGVRIDELLVMSDDGVSDVQIQSFFDNNVRLSTNIPEAAHFDAIEDSVRVYLGDYIKSNPKALAIATFKDSHCLMTYSNAGDGPTDVAGKVFRLDFPDRENMMFQIGRAILGLREMLDVENCMTMFWHEKSEFGEEGMGKIVSRKENGEWVFLDPYSN